MTRRRATTILTAAAIAVSGLLAGCSGDDDAEATTTTTEATDATAPLEDPPSCSALPATVDVASLEQVGCLEGDDLVAIPATVDCPDGDGTVVFISDRMGLDGGEWVEADEDWESLCP